MEMWLIFGMLAPVLWSFQAIASKFIRVKYIHDSLGYVLFLLPTVFYSLVLLFFEDIMEVTFPQIILIVVATTVSYFGLYFYLEALNREEVSIVTILLSLMPVYVLIMATFFLNETFTFGKYLGFGLVLIGSVIVSMNTIRRKERNFMGLVFVLLTIISWGTRNLIYKTVSELNLATVLVIGIFGYAFFAVIVLGFSKKARQETLKIHRALNVKKKLLVYGTEIVGMTGVFLFYTSIRLGPVSLVSVFENFKMAFVFLFALLLSKYFPHILEERTNKKIIALKLVSIVVMFIGIWLIA